MQLRELLEETKAKWNPLFVIYSWKLNRNVPELIGFEDGVTVQSFVEWNTENLYQWKKENGKAMDYTTFTDMEKYQEWLTKKYEGTHKG